MSNGTLETIMTRIAKATPQSPIAVFEKDTFDSFKHDMPVERSEPMLDAVFANTAETSIILEKGTRRLIGVFHCESDVSDVKARLEKAMNYSHHSDIQKDVLTWIKCKSYGGQSDIAEQTGHPAGAVKAALIKLQNIGEVEKHEIPGYWTVAGYKGVVKKNTIKQQCIDLMKKMKKFKARDLSGVAGMPTVATVISQQKAAGNIQPAGQHRWEWVA